MNVSIQHILSNIDKELPVNHRAKWTDENIKELVKLTKTNEIEFIIDSLGRTKGSIISQIRRAMNYKYLNKTDIKSNKILEIINKFIMLWDQLQYDNTSMKLK